MRGKLRETTFLIVIWMMVISVFATLGLIIFHDGCTCAKQAAENNRIHQKVESYIDHARSDCLKCHPADREEWVL